MSDYDSDDYDNYGEDMIEEQSENLIKYTSDGLSEIAYRNSEVAWDNLIKAECCHNYFKGNMYTHQTQYKLSIPGINMCIHCYISFNLHKFAECINLSKTEEDCLRYYIDNFTDDHNSEICNRLKIHGKCLLCESKIGIKPKICKKNNAFEVVELNHGTSSDPNNVTTTDIVLIGKTDVSDFVLVL